MGKASTVQINKARSSHQDKRGLEHRGSRTERCRPRPFQSPASTSSSPVPPPSRRAPTCPRSATGPTPYPYIQVMTDHRKIQEAASPHSRPATRQRQHVSENLRKSQLGALRTYDQTGESPVHKSTRVTLDAKPPLPAFPYIGSNCLCLSSS